MTTRLTTGDVCELAGGIPLWMLDRWVNRGLLRPSGDGEGTGNHRSFGLMDAVAVAYGAALRDSVLCGPGWVEEAIRFVANLDPARMEEEFAERRTVVLASSRPGGTMLVEMVLPPGVTAVEREVADSASLEVVYRRVLREAPLLAGKRTRDGWKSRRKNRKGKKGSAKGEKVK